MSLLGLQRDGSGPVLVWLHGFTQTKDSARTFRSILTGSYELLTIDLPGHGQNATIDASLEECADLLAGTLPTEPFILGGYSMGGRVAMHVALRYPERLSRLIVLSSTTGLADEGERLARLARDEELARHLERIGADAFLDEWLAQPMFSTLPDDPDERAARSHDARGLAASLRRAGTGTQAWLGARLADLATPTLVVAGALDHKFVVESVRLTSALSNARLALVSNAGHAAHLERPHEVARLFGA